MCNGVAMPNDDDLIDSGEAIEILGVYRSTLTRWVAAGRVTPVKRVGGPDGPMVFRAGDIRALVCPTCGQAKIRDEASA